MDGGPDLASGIFTMSRLRANLGGEIEMQENVSTIVLNWNGWRDTSVCISSLLRQTYTNQRVIVVDNGSTDDSVSRLRQEFPQVTLIENGANLGFSAGCNVGIRAALAGGAGFVWLLN